MTDPELRLALNLLVDSEVDHLRMNSVQLGEGRTLTIHAGGLLVLTDVVFLEFSLAGISVARVHTKAGGLSVLSMSQIYSLAVVVAAV